MKEEELNFGEIVVRCCVCGAVEANSRLIPVSEVEFDINELRIQNLLTDTYLSKQCLKDHLGGFEGLITESMLADAKYDRCPK